MAVQKRFPANTTMEVKTFLNDKKINSELYAYFQAKSVVEDGQTVVNKNQLGTQAEICKIIGLGSRMTYKAHLNYLLDMGFIENHPTKPNKYVLPDKEDIYFLIPLETVQFLYDCLTPDVVKIYIYLGQRDKYKKSLGPNEKYYFTYKELAEHIGIELDNHARNYQKIKNCLDCLRNNGLIDFEITYQGKVPYFRLSKFSLEYKKFNRGKK